MKAFKKAINTLCLILACAGFFLLLGAVGGLDQNLCTYEEFWRMAGVSVTMLVVGILGANFGEDESNNG